VTCRASCPNTYVCVCVHEHVFGSTKTQACACRRCLWGCCACMQICMFVLKPTNRKRGIKAACPSCRRFQPCPLLAWMAALVKLLDNPDKDVLQDQGMRVHFVVPT